MTGFSGLTGGVGGCLGLKTLFFANLKLKTSSLPEPQSTEKFLNTENFF
jgi:hypothetical protein